jgi:RHS repeat-associated protein
VTFAHDEQWCWDPAEACPRAGSYKINWVREFRYDGARARYLDRNLDPTAFKAINQQLVELDAVWTDYGGDDAYREFEVTPGSPPTITDGTLYQPGLWRQSGSSSAQYLHNDHLGTLRETSNSAFETTGLRVFTAFGEKISATTPANADRFGYVGEWGYQSHAEMSFFHVGHRYYDPGSGRFLQRDPIGMEGGGNVFAYAFGSPTLFIDEDGLSTNNPAAQLGTHPQGHARLSKPSEIWGNCPATARKSDTRNMRSTKP